MIIYLFWIILRLDQPPISREMSDLTTSFLRPSSVTSHMAYLPPLVLKSYPSCSKNKFRHWLCGYPNPLSPFSLGYLLSIRKYKLSQNHRENGWISTAFTPQHLRKSPVMKAALANVRTKSTGCPCGSWKYGHHSHRIIERTEGVEAGSCWEEHGSKWWKIQILQNPNLLIFSR